MIFKKKVGMVDVRELQKRGVVRIPRNDIVVPRSSDGFVDLNSNSEVSSSAVNDSLSGDSTGASDFLGFTGSSNISSDDSFSSSVDGYDKREVDSKISDLDNKIYKLEQRIELLERKLDVNQPSDNNVGVMGW